MPDAMLQSMKSCIIAQGARQADICVASADTRQRLSECIVKFCCCFSYRFQPPGAIGWRNNWGSEVLGTVQCRQIRTWYIPGRYHSFKSVRQIYMTHRPLACCHDRRSWKGSTACTTVVLAVRALLGTRRIASAPGDLQSVTEVHCSNPHWPVGCMLCEGGENVNTRHTSSDGSCTHYSHSVIY